MERAYRIAEVRGAEEPLLASGEPLMEQAPYALAQAVIRNLKRNEHTVPGSTVLVLVGAGNNGGDALFAATYLAQRGLSVTVTTAGDAHQGGLEAVRSLGIPVITNPQLNELRELARRAGTWIDGLLGIGARGAMRAPLASWVQALCDERAHSAVEPYVIAVDTPSGIGVDDGTIPGAVLPADVTVTMGCAKPGLFLPPARFMCGRIEQVPLGFEPYLPSKPALVQVSDADVRDLIKVPHSSDHKYTRGVLGMLTGSRVYPGAGVLSAGGARACGIGMIRHLSDVPDVVAAYPDIVTAPGQVQAWLIGSGIPDVARGGASDSDEALLRKVVSTFDSALEQHMPVVLDAGAIGLIYDRDVSANVVITPHYGELAQLLQARGEAMTRADVESAPARAARLAATLTGATVVAKGACTVIADSSGPLFAQSGGSGWLGTAGSGDVLAGIVGALLASNSDGFSGVGVRSFAASLAACACHIHARAGARAAGVPWGDGASREGDGRGTRGGLSRVGHPITAPDIVSELPAVFDEILNP